MNQDDPILAEFVAKFGNRPEYIPGVFPQQGSYWDAGLEGYRLGRAHQSEPVSAPVEDDWELALSIVKGWCDIYDETTDYAFENIVRTIAACRARWRAKR